MGRLPLPFLQKLKHINIMKLYSTNCTLIIEMDGSVKEVVEHCVRKGISLQRADLRKAFLCKANLRGADLEGANLRYADLDGANLYGSTLRGVDFYGADLEGAEGIIVFNKPKGRTCYAIKHDFGFMIKAGCFWDTLDQFEKACKHTYPNDPLQAYEAQISYLRNLQSQL